MKTVIEFTFLRPGGFSIEGFGNFWPHMGLKPVTIPNGYGQTWEVDYDFEKRYRVELPDETPRSLPKHIATGSDEAVKSAYHIKQASLAAEAHDANNRVRDQLAYHVDLGLIKIVSDSFYDQPEEVKAPEPPKAPSAPKK